MTSAETHAGRHDGVAFERDGQLSAGNDGEYVFAEGEERAATHRSSNVGGGEIDPHAHGEVLRHGGKRRGRRNADVVLAVKHSRGALTLTTRSKREAGRSRSRSSSGSSRGSRSRSGVSNGANLSMVARTREIVNITT